jgi:hypothetical protein
MKIATRVLYIISLVLGIIGFISMLLSFIGLQGVTAQEFINKMGSSASSMSVQDAETMLSVLKVLFLIFWVIELVACAFIIFALIMLGKPSYYHSKKIAVPVVSIILGLFDLPMLVAGILWVANGKRVEA